MCTDQQNSSIFEKIFCSSVYFVDLPESFNNLRPCKNLKSVAPLSLPFLLLRERIQYWHCQVFLPTESAVFSLKIRVIFFIGDSLLSKIITDWTLLWGA